MHTLTISFFITAATGAQASLAQTAPAPTWNTSLPEALAQAKASQTSVLAVFSGSDWCKPCLTANIISANLAFTMP